MTTPSTNHYIIRTAAAIADAFCLPHTVRPVTQTVNMVPGNPNALVYLNSGLVSMSGEPEVLGSLVIRPNPQGQPDRVVQIQGRKIADWTDQERSVRPRRALPGRSDFTRHDITNPLTIEEVLVEWERVCCTEVDLGSYTVDRCQEKALQEAISLLSEYPPGHPIAAVLKDVRTTSTVRAPTPIDYIDFLKDTYVRPVLVQ